MDLKLDHQAAQLYDLKQLTISGSKSESNRLLILKKLFESIEIENLSTSDDTKYLDKVLNSQNKVLDIGHAGTAMRFGTAYFAAQPGKEVILTGSDRMKQRPIGILVEALNKLGAQITYLEKEGFPPLKIHGQSLKSEKLEIDGSVSSQFLTALLLIGASLENGLQLEIKNLTSVPYLKMTCAILENLGVSVGWNENKNATFVTVQMQSSRITGRYTVESDWSSAGYWYSWTALQEPGFEMKLNHFKNPSLQGDSKIVEIYQHFGVRTYFEGTTLHLRKYEKILPEQLNLDFTDIPDQAQTVFATCLGLGIDLHFTGLHTLKVKETDRIEAMKMVGSRFRNPDSYRDEITTSHNDIKMRHDRSKSFKKDVIVDTFHDHRMAMAFAPLCAKTSLVIKDAGVVSKSYPTFWEDLKCYGVGISVI
ncbi:3-phosphoshikimate 1-carboxyvinyltransferase [Nonlabens spongiae]|uniref:3-phosphoshikimate 1-carboxyvinyltransferase n=1 Tax=Nonlabens spongiae TaxID=331648 RepID=A0A1W6MM95_9FLAO|nr:3-phosphoshikimate 1-carboxyvinyltransferase [Nonlabens spongiae]ARN78718.1 3-phosphoshikimate 1-carboxyvinyltransferase [Nonlabens spongiae]